MYKKVFIFTFFLLFSKITLYAHTLEFITDKQLQKFELIYGEEGKKRLLHFDKMLIKAKAQNTLQKLKTVNRFFNQITYKTDQQHWKEKDYWASPFEFIGSGAGDCEDFAIAKYFALRLLGIESSKMEITFAHLANNSKKENGYHVVLNYYHVEDAQPLILDNINKKLLLADKRKDIVFFNNINITKIIKLQKLFWS